MGRRHTAGVVGYQAVGGVQVDNTTFTAAENLDIVMDPSGTGLFKIAGDAQLQAQGDLRFADADSSNYVAFQAPATVAANITWTLPNVDGSSGQFLSTNASGTLSWASGSLSLSDQTTSSTLHYPLITTATSGTVTSSNVSSTKLNFTPSTGTLTTTILSATTINETSSITLKENFNPITNALDKISQLTAWTYDRKDGSQKNEAGLVAEEVYKVIPNIVTMDEQGKPMGINYTRLSAYLIEAIKTLQQDLLALTSK